MEIYNTVNQLKSIKNIMKNTKGNINKYNALKEYLDAIISNPELKATDLDKYPLLAKMSSDVKEKLVNEANALSARNKDMFNMNTADLVMAIDNLRNDRLLNEAQKYAFINTYARQVKMTVENTLRNLYPDSVFRKYEELSSKVLTYIQEGFALLYNDEAHGYDFVINGKKDPSGKQIEPSLIEDLMRASNKNITKEDINFVRQKFMSTYSNRSNRFSLKTVTEFIEDEVWRTLTVSLFCIVLLVVNQVPLPLTSYSPLLIEIVVGVLIPVTVILLERVCVLGWILILSEKWKESGMLSVPKANRKISIPVVSFPTMTLTGVFVPIW